MPIDSDFWAPFGEAQGRDFASTVSASELQLRFAVARFNGATAAKAAEIAGYAGSRDELRRAGYSAVRSAAVVAILDLAAVNAPAEAKISDKEIDAKIAKLIRSADPNVSLKAVDARDKRENARKADRQSAADNMTRDEILGQLLSETFGLGFVAILYLGAAQEYGPRFNVNALGLFPQLAPHVCAQYPEIWQRFLGLLDNDCRAEAQAMASASPMPIEQFIKRVDAETVSDDAQAE